MQAFRIGNTIVQSDSHAKLMAMVAEELREHPGEIALQVEPMGGFDYNEIAARIKMGQP